MSITSAEALRNAVYAIIDAGLTGPETRAAVMSLIPKEFHITHREKSAEPPSCSPSALV